MTFFYYFINIASLSRLISFIIIFIIRESSLSFRLNFFVSTSSLSSDSDIYKIKKKNEATKKKAIKKIKKKTKKKTKKTKKEVNREKRNNI
jgi:hypothetical protein